MSKVHATLIEGLLLLVLSVIALVDVVRLPTAAFFLFVLTV